MNQLKEQVGGQQQENARVRKNYWHPVGLTALMYLKEALHHECYEDCHSAVEIAREFGAQEWEIKNILNGNV